LVMSDVRQSGAVPNCWNIFTNPGSLAISLNGAFFPRRTKALVVSHPVKACKPGKALATCFARKTAFVMQNFRNLGDTGVGENFGQNPQNAHPCLISRVLSHRYCKYVHEFLLQVCARKKRTLQRVTKRLYFTYLRALPHQTKFNQ